MISWHPKNSAQKFPFVTMIHTLQVRRLAWRYLTSPSEFAFDALTSIPFSWIDWIFLQAADCPARSAAVNAWRVIPCTDFRRDSCGQCIPSLFCIRLRRAVLYLNRSFLPLRFRS